MSNKMSDRSKGKKNSGSHRDSYQSPRQSFHQSAKILGRIKCFNCHQKGHYATQCLKPNEGFNVFNESSSNDLSYDDLSSESDAPNSAVQD